MWCYQQYAALLGLRVEEVLPAAVFTEQIVNLQARFVAPEINQLESEVAEQLFGFCSCCRAVVVQSGRKVLHHNRAAVRRHKPVEACDKEAETGAKFGGENTHQPQAKPPERTAIKPGGSRRPRVGCRYGAI